MRNVEIKARVHDLARLRELAAELSRSPGEQLDMTDTFFHCNVGRLKLREMNGGDELIFYDRPDASGPKVSEFSLAQIGGDVAALRETLSRALGVRGEVRKTRFLYMVGQTRVHVDRVAGLGDFMELEVQLRDDETAEDGRVIAEDLMWKLEVQQADLLEGAYMDMLDKQQ